MVIYAHRCRKWPRVIFSSPPGKLSVLVRVLTVLSCRLFRSVSVSKKVLSSSYERLKEVMSKTMRFFLSLSQLCLTGFIASIPDNCNELHQWHPSFNLVWATTVHGQSEAKEGSALQDRRSLCSSLIQLVIQLLASVDQFSKALDNSEKTIQFALWWGFTC